MGLAPVWINEDLQRKVKIAAAITGVSMRRLSEDALKYHLAADERTQDLIDTPPQEEPTPCPSTS